MQKDHLVGGDGGGVQGAANCFAADGVTPTYTVSSLPLMVCAMDFNKVYAELVRVEESRTEVLEALNNILVGMEVTGGWDGDDELFNAGTAVYKKATGAA